MTNLDKKIICIDFGKRKKKVEKEKTKKNILSLTGFDPTTYSSKGARYSITASESIHSKSCSKGVYKVIVLLGAQENEND